MTYPELKYRLQLKVNDMAKNNLLQGAVWESEDQKWYLTQAQDAGARDRQHTYIRRFAKNGAYEGFMKLVLFGHGNAIGVRKSASGNIWVWVPMDSYNSSGKTIRTQVARVQWQKGHTYERKERGSGGTVDIFADDKADNGFGLGPPGRPGPLFLRRGHNGYEIYRKVNEVDYVAHNGKTKVLGEVRASKHNRGHYFQGCGAEGDIVAVLSGRTNLRHCIDFYSFSKQRKVKRLEWGKGTMYNALHSHVSGPGSYEAEGLHFVDGRLYMGVRTGPSGKKRDFSIVEILNYL